MNTNLSPDPKHPVNYVFVDCENVSEVDLSVIGAKTVHFTLLVGPHQTRLDAALVEKLLEHTSSTQLVRLQSSGRNALDFALAFYLGKEVHADPAAYFHIVSKDTGFDPLIEHLKSRHVRARRHDNFTSLTFSAPPKTPVAPVAAPEDDLTRILDHLRKHPNNRPKRKKTLASHLKPLLGPSATEARIEDLINKLCQAGHLRIAENGALTYSL